MRSADAQGRYAWYVAAPASRTRDMQAGKASTGHSLYFNPQGATMEITTTQAVAAMQKEGGNGMQKLAACWIAMDEERRKRLEQAFEPEFTKYRGVYADLLKVAQWKAAV